MAEVDAPKFDALAFRIAADFLEENGFEAASRYLRHKVDYEEKLLSGPLQIMLFGDSVSSCKFSFDANSISVGQYLGWSAPPPRMSELIIDKVLPARVELDVDPPQGLLAGGLAARLRHRIAQRASRKQPKKGRRRADSPR